MSRESRRQRERLLVSDRREYLTRSIVSAAMQCFKEKGVAKTKIVDVTRAAHITRELFYYYFADKDALCGAVFEECVSSISSAIAMWAMRWVGTDPLRTDEALLDLCSQMRGLVAVSQDERTTMMSVLKQMHAVSRAFCRGCADGGCPEVAFVVLGILGLLEADPHMSDQQILDSTKASIELLAQ